MGIPAFLLLAALIQPQAAGSTELVGQVVCSQCWHEADRNRVPYGTPADLACAARCAAQGVPAALAVKDEGGFQLLRVEGERDWSEWIGRFARIRGATGERDGQRVLRVDSAERLEESPWSVATDAPQGAALAWTDLGGHSQTLDAFRGRIVVLNFWATWCAPCRKEMPDLVQVQNGYGMYGVQVLGAAADPTTAGPTVAEFARELRVNFPVLLGASGRQMQSLGLGVALPATVVIDRHGHVVERISGMVEREKLEALLDRLVHGEHAAATGEADPAEVASTAGRDHRPRPGSGAQASLVPS